MMIYSDPESGFSLVVQDVAAAHIVDEQAKTHTDDDASLVSTG